MSKVLDSRLQQISRLIEGTICKQTKLAEAYEYETDQKASYLRFKAAVMEYDVLSDYDYMLNDDMFEAINRSLLPEDQISKTDWDYLYAYNGKELRPVLKNLGILDSVMNYLRSSEILETYVEYNPYYRMLLGKPPIDTPDEDYIYIERTTVRAGVSSTEMVPIHHLTKSEIFRLKKAGRLDTLIAQHPDKEYLRYLDKDINLIEAREAGEFEILYTPNKREFTTYREMFNNERKVWLKTYGSTYMIETTDYDESLELTTIKLRAICMFYIFTYSNSLNKTTYTREESEDKFQEFGLSFPSRMPDSYRDSLTFVLSYINTFKGTNFALDFIARKIFSGLRLYKYWIRKRVRDVSTDGFKFPVGDDGALVAPNREYEDARVYDIEKMKKLNPGFVAAASASGAQSPLETTPESLYHVDFVLRPINSTNIIDFDNMEGGTGDRTSDPNSLDDQWGDVNHAKSIKYILPEYEDYSKGKSKEIVLSYDEVVAMDPRWENSAQMKHAVYSEDFSYVESKYLAVDNIVKISDFTTGIGVIHRYILKYKDMLLKTSFPYRSTGHQHSWFALWVYFITFINYNTTKNIDAPIGDTVGWVEKMLDFNTIKTHPTIRFYWLNEFAQTGIDITLEEFPDPVNNNDDFIKMLQKIERSIGLARFLDAVLLRARNHKEVDLILEVYNYVRIGNKQPDKFNATGNEDKSWYRFLEEIDPNLAYHFDLTILHDDADEISMEMDNISTALLDIVKNQESAANGSFPDIKEVIFSSGMIYGGMSQYLQYIIKLFKAWRVEFLGEGNALILMGDDDDYLLIVDQLTPNVNIKINTPRWNYTQYHWVEPAEDNNVTLCDEHAIHDDVYMHTRYGEIKIS